MKPLDIVKTPKGGIAIITETNDEGQSASIDFIHTLDPHRERNSWWDKKELKVIDSLPRLIASNMSHPFGEGDDDVKLFFPLTKKSKL